jgi:hypothetical protein
MLPSRSATNKAAATSRGFVREAQIGGKPLVQKNVSVDAESGKPMRLESFSIPLAETSDKSQCRQSNLICTLYDASKHAQVRLHVRNNRGSNDA